MSQNELDYASVMLSESCFTPNDKQKKTLPSLQHCNCILHSARSMTITYMFNNHLPCSSEGHC